MNRSKVWPPSTFGSNARVAKMNESKLVRSHTVTVHMNIFTSLVPFCHCLRWLLQYCVAHLCVEKNIFALIVSSCHSVFMTHNDLTVTCIL